MKRILFCIATIFLIYCDRVYAQEYQLTEVENIAIKDMQCGGSQSASLVQKKVTSKAIAKDWCNQWNIVYTSLV